MERKINTSFEAFERRYEEKEKEQREADRNVRRKAEKRKKKIEEQKKRAESTKPSFGAAPQPPPVSSVDTKRKDMLSRLGLPASESSVERIKSAYKSLALKLHPDKNGGQDAEFKRVLEAYEYLCKK
jgi:hypothetical protein